MKKTIFEEYGIKVQDMTKWGPYDSFRVHQTHFLIVPVSHIDEEELYELYQLGQFMIEKKEHYVANFILTKKSQLFFEKDESRFVITKCSSYPTGRFTQIGKELARFHQKARSYPYQVTKTLRIGQWKFLWEKRLDQLESFWQGRVHNQPLNQFEKLFAESFPYYLGIAENAIQYLVDTELDEEPQLIDSGTICHHRFNSTTWRSEMSVKLPTEWIFDHGSRDIAEYMRHLFFDEQEELKVNGFSFLDEYDRTTPLSAFSWRLIYSRLLFPIHYFECVENYYLTPEDDKHYYEERMEDLLNRSRQYESFLASFSNMLSMKTRKIMLPTVEWLA